MASGRTGDSDASYAVGLLLAGGFDGLHLALARRVLAAANRLDAGDRYRVTLYTAGNAPVVAADGAVLRPEAKAGGMAGCDALIAIAGADPDQALQPALYPWLRRLARGGALLGAVGTGAVLLAEAGLAHGRRVAVAENFAAVFRDRYPDVRATAQAIVFDGGLLSCPGGLSVVEMMTDYVAATAGDVLARRVAAALRWGRSPEIDAESRAHSDLARRCLEVMHGNLARPLSLEQLAAALDAHPRSLARRFAAAYGETPVAYYRRLRLERARDLLQRGDHSVAQAAAACGFASPANFATAFRHAFGAAPRDYRG
jgi:AraC family carnitine catabolism transcriptional activator